MRILYVGPLGSGETSDYRYRALQRLGHEVIPFDTALHALRPGKLDSLARRFPTGPLIYFLNQALLRAAKLHAPQIVWFDRPQRYTPATMRRLHQYGAFLINYTQDTPFCQHEGNRWDWMQYHRVLPLLDLHGILRQEDEPRYAALGVNTIRTQLSYDPAQHFAPPDGWTDADRVRELSFVGTPRDNRAQIARSLYFDHKLPLTVSGPRWNRYLSHQESALFQRGAMMRDAEYREAIWKSKINLAFITKNGEDVAHKAFEITACGGFLLAERSDEHRAKFEEGKEAEFFSSTEECAQKALYYLEHPTEREAIAARGHQRATQSGYDNDTQLRRFLDRAEELMA